MWIGIAAFGFIMFYGMYILVFSEIPASEREERQMLIETGAAIFASALRASSFSACRCGVIAAACCARR